MSVCLCVGFHSYYLHISLNNTTTITNIISEICIMITLRNLQVQTELGSSAGSPPLTPFQSITGVRNVIASSKLEHSALFVDFENKPLPW